MNLRHGARHNTYCRAGVLPGRCAPRSDGWLGGVGHGVAKRSHSLERPGGSVSSSSWEAWGVFLCSSHPRARARGCNELHFLGEEQVKHQRSFGVQCYKTFMSVDVLEKMNGNQSFVVIFRVDPDLR